jgi:lysozyme
VNPPDNWYCGRCGATINPLGPVIDNYLDSHVRQHVDGIIKERFGEREVAELAVTASIASRLGEWAKVYGFLLGIPITIAVGCLGFFGWKVNDSLSSTKTEIAQLKTDMSARQNDLSKLKGDVKQVQTDMSARRNDLSELKGEVENRQRDVKQVGDSISKIKVALAPGEQQAEQVGKQLAALSQRLTDFQAQNQVLTKRVDTLTVQVAGLGTEAFIQATREGKARGLDISHNMSAKSLDWPKLKSEGISFVFVKASQGTQFRDPLFVDHWRAAGEAGVLRGAYHILSGGGAAAQAESFLQVIKGDRGELPPVVDFERNPAGNTATVEDVLEFSRIIHERTGCTPILYTGPGMVGDAGDALAQLANLPLWWAQYSPVPRVPHPWQKFTFWQAGDRLSINGGPATDFEVYDGTVEQLKAFADSQCRGR